MNRHLVRDYLHSASSAPLVTVQFCLHVAWSTELSKLVAAGVSAAVCKKAQRSPGYLYIA